VSRNWQLFLADIEEAALKVERRTRTVSFAQFVADGILYDAVVRNLEIVGEAAKGIPDDVRARSPSVDWRRIAGLRDVLAPQLVRHRRRDALGYRPEQDSAVARCREAAPEERHVSLEQ